jgi:hypothetical protein
MPSLLQVLMQNPLPKNTLDPACHVYLSNEPLHIIFIYYVLSVNAGKVRTNPMRCWQIGGPYRHNGPVTLHSTVHPLPCLKYQSMMKASKTVNGAHTHMKMLIATADSSVLNSSAGNAH